MTSVPSDAYPDGPPSTPPPPAPPIGGGSGPAHLLAPPPTGPPMVVPGHPGPTPPGGAGGRVRPWWGMGDIALSVPVIIGAAIAATLLALPFSDLEGLMNGDQEATPLAILVFSLYAQQTSQGLWPFVVSRWKGLGPVPDWKFRFVPMDLLIGLGTAVIALGLSAAVSTVIAQLVDLQDEAEATNTQFLVDAEGSPWMWFLLLAVVVGAPLSEELFFRGLVLRAIEKRAGPLVAVLGSALIFTLPHFTGAGLAGSLVLFSTIGVVGLVLGTVAVITDRLGPTIVAHALFNAIGAAGALGAFGDLPT